MEAAAAVSAASISSNNRERLSVGKGSLTSAEADPAGVDDAMVVAEDEAVPSAPRKSVLATVACGGPVAAVVDGADVAAVATVVTFMIELGGIECNSLSDWLLPDGNS